MFEILMALAFGSQLLIMIGMVLFMRSWKNATADMRLALFIQNRDALYLGEIRAVLFNEFEADKAGLPKREIKRSPRISPRSETIAEKPEGTDYVPLGAILRHSITKKEQSKIIQAGLAFHEALASIRAERDESKKD